MCQFLIYTGSKDFFCVLNTVGRRNCYSKSIFANLSQINWNTFFGFLAGSSSATKSSGIAEGSSGAAGPDQRKLCKSGDPI